MKPLVFVENENGKIELTKEQLQQLLDDCYYEGIKDGSKTIVSYSESTTPYWMPKDNWEITTPHWMLNGNLEITTTGYAKPDWVR